ncbi:hypothetical protein K4K55_011750 [Colletotrichum sp. SAR 10_96]|nr:hypothetical protein K4K55_011750 [Colletotrichum sp. SAR 10_96]
MAVLSIYGMWEHLARQPAFARLFLYVLIGVSALSLLFLSSLIVYRNGLLYYDFPRASISNSGDVVTVELRLSRPIIVDAGQSISLSKLQKAQQTYPAVFGGPHGMSIPVTDYDVVLMVASGYGIAAQLPYLKRLIYEFNSRKARTRRIHLLWKLETIGYAYRSLSTVERAFNDGM